MFRAPGAPYELEAEHDEAAPETVRLAPSRGLLEALRNGWTERAFLAPLLVFLVSFGIFAAFSANHVVKQSTDPHFVYLAETMNSMVAASLGSDEAQERRSNRLPFELERNPPHGNDWASFWEIELDGGEQVRGFWLDKQGQGRFKLLGKEEALFLERSDVVRAKKKRRHFVSFPPGPAVLMMPFVAAVGSDLNDVLFTIFFASLNVALVYILLRRLARGGRTGRGRSENLWLTALFGFGTVHLWCSILGQVWFTALVIGVTFSLLYILCAMDTRRPFLAGCFLAAAFATRTPLLFSCVFFYAFVFFPGGRLRREGWGEAVRKIALFSAPCIVVGLSLLWMNFVRFGEATEFGHTYLATGTLARIRDYGLFNFHFLSKNLAALFTLLPRIQPNAPYILISLHGMSIFATTPAFIYLLRPLARENVAEVFWHRLCWGTVAAIAATHLLYQNTGYEQFGYRFALDYMPYLIVLLAIGRRPITRAFKAAIVAGFAVNAFGAVTFKRMTQFYTREFFP